MMMCLKDEELIAWARDQEPSAGLVHILCDALEEKIGMLKPKPRSWEGVWGEFDARKRQENSKI
jgi:hypothetical protein